MLQNSFSIVMPNYNKEHYIYRTIHSILNQTYKAFELIIVDDGSTDNSNSIIKLFSDSRIKLISQKNQGVSVARNTGIKEAKYSFVAFVDSDDYWYPFYLEKMNQLINKYPNAGAYGCVLEKRKIEKDEIVVSSWDKGTENDFIIDNYFHNLLCGGYTLTASSTVIRKEITSLCGVFPVGLKNWEDYDMWIRIALYSNICFTDLVCGIYNDVANSASRDRTNLHAPVFDNYKFHIKNSGISGQIKKDFVRLVEEKKQHAAYEKYLFNHEALPALEVYFRTIRHSAMDITYWSAILQFIFTPERVFNIKKKLMEWKNGR